MTKFFRQWKGTLMIGLLVLLLALFLRLYNLDSIPIFADEAIYVRWAQIMKAEETLRFLPLSDGKQPLFMWLVIPFLKIVSDPLFAGRITSVFASTGTLIGVFFVTYYLFKSKKTALTASLIYAISPFSVFFNRMALVDPLLCLFGVWTFFLGVLTAKTRRLDFAILTGFALGGALLTKSSGLFFSVLLPSTWILTNWQGTFKKKVIQLIKLTLLLLVTYSIAYGLYNILRLGPNFHLISSRNQDYVLPISHLWTNPRDPFIFYFDRAFEWATMLGPSLIWPLAFLGFIFSFSKKRREILVIGLWYLFPILVQSEFAKVFTARYILFSMPFLFIIAASCFKDTVFKGGTRIIGLLILGLFIAQALWMDYLLVSHPEKANLPRSERSGYLEEWTAGTGIKEVAKYLRKQETQAPGKRIVVGTEGYFGTLPDGLQIYLNDLRDITIVGVGVNIDQVPSSLKESKKAGNRTFLVVNSSRFTADAGKSGLKLIASYQKAQPPTSARDSLLFFELTD